MGAKNLVIVESPAKAKTIEGFLGKDFKVCSSYGHIRDLKKKDFGVDLETFQPHYVVPVDKKKVVTDLKAEAKKATMVWLASDEDREGEAIAWHLAEVLKLDKQKTRRIVFHEITKTAIQEAIANPRDIDIDLVDAQQARRVLDRIVGFKLSPILWRKVRPSLSAGRVQSVTVRLLVEREREINSFESEAEFRVVGVFEIEDTGVEFKAKLSKEFKTEMETESFIKSCRESIFTISSVCKKPSKRSPVAPFTTSTLQQEAVRKLGFSVSQTMVIAQRLYESGLITYMRTDSVNLSEFALKTSAEVISDLFGEKYVHQRNYSTKAKGAQEAHEAIRPTNMSLQEIQGTAQEQRLYKLIWKRTLASQMADAKLEKTTITIQLDNREETFVTMGEVILFDGFLKLYRENIDSEEEGNDLLPKVEEGQKLLYKNVVATEKYSQPPGRYTEASLVHKLEELGIGRPSTYAPTIGVIQQREYVKKGDKEGKDRGIVVLSLEKGNIVRQEQIEKEGNEKNKLIPTDMGIVVNDFLTAYFPEILDYNFTARVEQQFDEIAEGKCNWINIISQFYKEFEPLVEKILAQKEEHKIGERILGVEPNSGEQVLAKIGRFGPIIQIGATAINSEEKPRFASIPAKLSIETITLEEALELFKLPRLLGKHEELDIVVNIGRFGPYVQQGKFYVSIPKDEDPLSITLERAIELIDAKKEEEKKKVLKVFEDGDGLSILNGRYGPYISYQGKNYRIPKQKVEEIENFTLLDCLSIVKNECDKHKEKKGRGKK